MGTLPHTVESKIIWKMALDLKNNMINVHRLKKRCKYHIKTAAKETRSRTQKFGLSTELVM